MAITVGASTITMNSGSVLQDPPGTAPSFLCRAWVNFDGTLVFPGTIRGSGNVSSITFTSAGDYFVNFTTEMPDTNYAIQTTTNLNLLNMVSFSNNLFTTFARVIYKNISNESGGNPSLFFVAVFR